MKTAVVYYSQSGNTKLVMDEIAKSLGADVVQLKPVKAYPDKGFAKFFHGGKSATFKETPKLEEYTFNVEDYDLIVLGTPIWAGTITPPLRTFLSENSLSGKAVAAVVCCSGGNPKKAFATIKQLAGTEQLKAELNLINPLKKGADITESVSSFCTQLV